MNGLTKRRKIGYASGIVSESVLYNMFYTYFLVFLTDTVGINPAIAGTISMIAIIFDGITDPIIGHIADKKGMDKRKLMKSAVIPMVIIFAFTFTKFNLSGISLIIYFAVVASLFWVAYTVYTIPYYALCAELTTDYDERTKIRGTSSFINAFAIFAGSALPVLFTENLVGGMISEELSWVLAAAAMGAIAIVFGFIAYKSTKDIKLVKTEKDQNENIFKTYLQVIKLKPFKYLLAFVVFFMIQSSLAQADLMYLLEHRMQVNPDDFMAVALGAIVLGMIIFVPITTKLSTIKDRKFAVVVLLSFATIGMFAFKFIGITSIFALVGMLLFYAAGLAVFWTTFYSFTYDIAEVDDMVNSKRRVGAITSLPQLLQKVGAALGMQVLGLVLSISGYNAEAAVQSQSAVLGIESAITVISPIFMALAVLFMALYPVTKSRCQKLQIALEDKKAGKEYNTDGLEKIL